MKPFRYRTPEKSSRRTGFMVNLRSLTALLLGSLLVAACVEDDPRYPVYYRFMVDVKVDGQPVRIERVIKCTGTLVTRSTYAPSVTGGGTYRNPQIMGAFVPGTREAVYTPVVHACRWASATPEERANDAAKVHRSLDRAFTEADEYLPPDAVLPVLWVSDDKTLDQMEYYVSEQALAGFQSHVEFVKAHPPEIVDEAAFEASEIRAETESPDLTPFIFPRDQGAAKDLQLYKDRFGAPRHGFRVVTICHAAWRIPRSEWSKVPGLEDWAASLPQDQVGYRLPSDLWKKFSQTIPGSGARNDVTLVPIKRVTELKQERSGRFATFDQIHPVILTDDGSYVDLSRTGYFGCNYDVLNPSRKIRLGGENFLKNVPPNGGYSFDLQGDRLEAAFQTQTPVFVPELDSFFVFRELSVSSLSIDEPVVKGWKE